MIEKENCTNIGECVKLHGVKGELVIRLNSGIYIDDIEADFMHFDMDGGLVPFKIKSIRPKNDTDILVSFFDTENENTVKRMITSQVYVETKDLNTDVSYEDDLSLLEGWLAKDVNAGELGVIKEVMEIKNNPLFIIDHKGTEFMIPANDDMIEEFDEENRILLFRLPEGLVDVNE
ncbi:MAG: hypothetical protein GXO47_06765 [Chlorobi bacterium]|nr:hypothetical protein [Chlorobiota bacterium]